MAIFSIVYILSWGFMDLGFTLFPELDNFFLTQRRIRVASRREGAKVERKRKVILAFHILIQPNFFN